MNFSDWANQFTTTANNLSQTVLNYRAGSAAITNTAQQPIPSGYVPGMNGSVGGVSTKTLLIIAGLGIVGIIALKKFA